MKGLLKIWNNIMSGYVSKLVSGQKWMKDQIKRWSNCLKSTVLWISN